MSDAQEKLEAAIKGARERENSAERVAEAKRIETREREIAAQRQLNAWSTLANSVIKASVQQVSRDAILKKSPLCITEAAETPFSVRFRVHSPSNPGGVYAEITFSLTLDHVAVHNGATPLTAPIPREQVNPEWVKGIATAVLTTALGSYRP